MRVTILHAAILGPAILIAALAGPVSAQVPVTPVIGLDPSSLDFGICTLIGDCAVDSIQVFNDVNDPTSILEVTSVVLNGDVAFALEGPTPPISIPGDGSVVTFLVRFCPIDLLPQTGEVVVTAANAYNSPRATSLSATPNIAPHCDAGGPYAAVIGHPVAFSALGSGDPGGTITAYAWDFGDGATGSGPTPSHTYTALGTYTATLTLTDNCGTTSTCEAVVLITAEPINQPPVCDAGGPYGRPPGMPIQFDGRGSFDPDGTIVLYAWDFGDGTTGTGPRPTHAYAANGVYTVTLCVTDDRQAIRCCTTTAEVGPLPVEPATWGHIKSRYRD